MYFSNVITTDIFNFDMFSESDFDVIHIRMLCDYDYRRCTRGRNLNKNYLEKQWSETLFQFSTRFDENKTS